MVDVPLFPTPDYRRSRPRKVERWGPWKGPTTTCDDCALLIGTQQATFTARAALYGLSRTDGTVGAYCTPHARERGCTA